MAFLLALIVFTILTPISASANDRDIFDESYVHCEHYLKGDSAINAKSEMEKQVIGRPFVFRELNDARPAALAFLNLRSVRANQFDRLIMSLTKNENGIQPLKFRLQYFSDGQLQDLFFREFPDDEILFWPTVMPDRKKRQVTHSSLTAQSPVPERPDFQGGHLGYVTDPAANGVRVYVAAHEYAGELGTINFELGLDVPCQDVEHYFDLHLTYVRPVLTSATNYCRVPVFVFSRPVEFEPSTED